MWIKTVQYITTNQPVNQLLSQQEQDEKDILYLPPPHIAKAQIALTKGEETLFPDYFIGVIICLIKLIIPVLSTKWIIEQ